METADRTQQKTSIPARSQRSASICENQSDHNKILVFGNASQITPKYNFLQTPVKSQQNISIWKHQSDYNKTQVFANSRCQKNTSILKQLDHNEIEVF